MIIMEGIIQEIVKIMREADRKIDTTKDPTITNKTHGQIKTGNIIIITNVMMVPNGAIDIF